MKRTPYLLRKVTKMVHEEWIKCCEIKVRGHSNVVKVGLDSVRPETEVKTP
jgi:aryl carrier-like protein